MHQLSQPQQVYYLFLGSLYAFAYKTRVRRLLGMSVQTWLTGLAIFLLVAAWTQRWGSGLKWGALAIFSLLQAAYFIGRRAGYSKFVPDETAVLPAPDQTRPLPANEHINLWATGPFSVRDREEKVLLRPAEYWQVPLGEHVVMVKMGVERFLYQFFDAEKLQQIQTGWLIFGRQPFLSTAITFLGQKTDKPLPLYAMLQGFDGEPALNQRTIYLTFEDEERQRAVWHNVISDARRVRSDG